MTTERVAPPNLPAHTFPVDDARRIIHDICAAELGGKTYQPEVASEMTRNVTDKIKHAMKGLKLDRYKYCVQVVLFTQKGQGVDIVSKNFWDDRTDAFVSVAFENASLACVASVAAVYFY